MTAPASAMTTGRPSARWIGGKRLRTTLLSGAVGGGVGAGLAFILGGCTTCAVGSDMLGISLLVGAAAAYGAWSGQSRS
jgi:hypothetical protein